MTWVRPAPSAAGVRRAGGWHLVVALVALGSAVLAASGDDAAAQTAVTPVLSCSGGMVLDSGSGRCLTPRTQTVARSSWCPAGSTLVAGRYGGSVCQYRVTTTVDTGRTRQVYSHTTYDRVWMPTGTKRVRTGTDRVWVKPRTYVEPLVPPVRVRVGTKRRCNFDPISLTSYACRTVPVYEYRLSTKVTIPGYWREVPVYSEVETGYWDRVANRHYTTERVLETATRWVTSPARLGPCGAGWRTVGSECQRTVLGAPSAPASQSCPAGSVPRYADALGGAGLSALTCRTPAPGADTGIDHDDKGGPGTSRDGTARPPAHLASESDERLAELGIHRCANGLLSYVPCGEMPGRTWNSDPEVCDGIDGTSYRPDHGGSCVTPTDLLTKCTSPGDCEKTTIRTYCPAIGQLAKTEIQEHVHRVRGPETYRVCIFDCSSFAQLPRYVRTRIDGSNDYACLPAAEPDAASPDTTTTSTITTSTSSPTSTTTTASTSTTAAVSGETSTSTTVPSAAGRAPTRTTVPLRRPQPPTRTTAPPAHEPPPAATPAPSDEDCPSMPPPASAQRALAALGLGSHVRSAGGAPSPQQHLPGGGRYLQVAPGRGWAEVRGPVDVDESGCRWIATWVRVGWADQRPWVPAERDAMRAGTGMGHLLERWELLSAQERDTLRRWHRAGAVPGEVVCAVADAAGPNAAASCGWVLVRSAAYAWHAAMCFELEQLPDEPLGEPSPARGASGEPTADDACWMPAGSGVDWIRSTGDYASDRITLDRSGNGS
ncbi:hypothetical protein [Candidatus Poriferisodalis sp.]|uniref:hypothetical protein n=1 Tax=Candidatus Poriferisodalis sp. TaxID=3101277 RepID=UPI003B01306E